MHKPNKQESYYSFTTSTGNVIWTALMPLVWRQIRQSFAIQQPLSFEHPSTKAQKIIQTLNDLIITTDILPEDSYYLKCGLGQKTVNLINRQLKKRMGLNKTLSLDECLDDMDFISYAYIYKSLTFINKFERRKDRSFRFNNSPVDSFFAKHYEQKQQIKCYFYEDRSNFMIEIRLKQETGSIFLLKNRKIKTVKNAINTVLTSVKLKQSFTIGKKDRFEMPFINIGGLKQYKEVEGLQFKNKELEGYLVKRMYEQFRLQIDECGAILEAQGVLIAFKCPSKAAAQPREFLLDESFWIVLKQQAKTPYFCAFVQSATDKG